MYTAIMVLLILFVINSHQQELVTYLEPTETFWIGEFESDVITETVWFGDFDSSLVFSVSPTEELTSEYSTADTAEESILISTPTEWMETSNHITADTTEESTSISTPTEWTETSDYITADSTDKSVSDSTTRLVDTTSPHTITIRPTPIVKTTRATNVSKTSTIIALNATHSTPDADDTTSAIIGGVIGCAAGVAAVVAVVVLAWRRHQRLKLVSKDQLGAGLNGGATSSRRHLNTYIMGLPSSVRQVPMTSSDTTESNELNIMITTNEGAGHNNDVGYKNTNLGRSYDEDLYANSGDNLYVNTGDVYINTGGLSDGENHNLSECSVDTAKTEIDNDMYVSVCDDSYLNTRESYDNKNVDIEPINFNTTKTLPDDIYETSILVLSNREPPVKINNNDFEKENEELYVKPDGPFYVKSEDLYLAYDGAISTEAGSLRSGDGLRKHGGVKTTQDKAALGIADSLYINASPQSSLRHGATSHNTVGGPGFSSPYSGYYKNYEEVADTMFGNQDKADHALEDHEYANIKSVEKLGDYNIS